MSEKQCNKAIAISLTQDDIRTIKTVVYMKMPIKSELVAEVRRATRMASPCTYLSEQVKDKYFTVLMGMETYKKIADMLHEKGKTYLSEYIYDEVADMSIALQGLKDDEPVLPF